MDGLSWRSLVKIWPSAGDWESANGSRAWGHVTSYQLFWLIQPIGRIGGCWGGICVTQPDINRWAWVGGRRFIGVVGSVAFCPPHQHTVANRSRQDLLSRFSPLFTLIPLMARKKGPRKKAPPHTWNMKTFSRSREWGQDVVGQRFYWHDWCVDILLLLSTTCLFNTFASIFGICVFVYISRSRCSLTAESSGFSCRDCTTGFSPRLDLLQGPI